MAKAKRPTDGGFTMKEYMQRHGIPGNSQNPHVNRLMREHFAKLGLAKVRRKRGWLWLPKEQVEASRTNVSDVERRLKEIRNGK